MPKLTLTITVKDGAKNLEGFPYSRQLDLPAAQGVGPYLKAPDVPGWFPSFPCDRIINVVGLIATANKETCWMFNGQNDAPLPLLEDGIIVLWDTDLDDGQGTNVRINVPQEEAATVRGYVMGYGVEDTEIPENEGYGDEGFGSGGFGT